MTDASQEPGERCGRSLRELLPLAPPEKQAMLRRLPASVLDSDLAQVFAMFVIASAMSTSRETVARMRAAAARDVAAIKPQRGKRS
jgi:hypothetical protein